MLFKEKEYYTKDKYLILILFHSYQTSCKFYSNSKYKKLRTSGHTERSSLRTFENNSKDSFQES